MLTFERLASTWDPAFLEELRKHYSRSKGPPPGKKMVWLAREDGEPAGYFGLGEPAFKLAPRRRLGLEDARPLERTVSIFVFRRIRFTATPGSALVLAWLPVAARDWDAEYGWRPCHWETMVDPGEVASKINPGACFKHAGFRELGWTTGRSARRPPGATHGARVWTDAAPKLVLYRGPLTRLPAPPGGPARPCSETPSARRAREMADF